MSTFYVINLERRSDRKESFLERFKEYIQCDSTMSVKFITATDGSIVKSYKNHSYYNKNNDFQDNPRVFATALSHIDTWKEILQSNEEYGIICEDDILFREDYKAKKMWPKIEQGLQKIIKNADQNNNDIILYFGVGDILPIHTNLVTTKGISVSESLLNSIEKSIVFDKSIIYDHFGIPKMDKSAYVFDWLGAFAYILSKKTIINLLKVIEQNGITTAIDIFLLNYFNPTKQSNEVNTERYFIVPLLCYHTPCCINFTDSDTIGISYPTPSENEIKNEKIPSDLTLSFLLYINSNSKSKTIIKSNIERIIDSIIFKNTKEGNINIIINNIEQLNEQNSPNEINLIEIIKTYLENNLDNPEDVSIYNNLEKDLLEKNKINIFIIPNVSDSQTFYNTYALILSNIYDSNKNHYIGIWNPSITIYSSEYDKYFYFHTKKINSELSCYVFRTKNSLEFSCFFLSNKLVKTLGHISPTPEVNLYLLYLSYLTGICVYIRYILIYSIPKINTTTIVSNFKEDPNIKKYLKEDINKIKNTDNFIPCGIWNPLPSDWETSDIIGTNHKF